MLHSFLVQKPDGFHHFKFFREVVRPPLGVFYEGIVADYFGTKCHKNHTSIVSFNSSQKLKTMKRVPYRNANKL